MDKKVKQDIVDFFEGYELAHKLTTRSIDRFLHVFSITTKNDITSIKVIEKIKGQSDNLFCDVRIEGNKITLLFRLTSQAKKLEQKIKEIKKSYFTVNYLGTNLKIIIANPTLKDVSDTFVELEKYCRRRVG